MCPAGHSATLGLVEYQRSAELKMAFNRAKYRQRIQQEDPAVIGVWFEPVEETKAKYVVHDDDLHRAKDAHLEGSLIKIVHVVTVSERRARPELVQPGDREWVTVIQSICIYLHNPIHLIHIGWV